MGFFILILAILLCSCVESPKKDTLSAPRRTEIVHFSPKGGCVEAVYSFIREAKISIHMQAYGFTSDPITDALCDAAKKPGITVEVLLDSDNRTDKYSKATKVAACGVKVLFDAKHQIAHNKILIIDGISVETGSFNYTQAAERGNAENCLFIRNDAPLAAQYESNWQSHKLHSEP